MRRRRVIAALLAAYTVVVASGAPLPLAWVTAHARPTVTGGERFPCESCPCGCGTAENCWGACCCHTLAERLAWARREGVRPPETALDEAEHAGLDVRQWRPGARYVVRPVVEVADASLPPCCRQARACCSAKPQAAKKAPQPRGVAILKALACQGIADAWLSLGQAPIAYGPELVVCDATFYVADAPAPLWRSWEEEPAPPPPDWRALVG